MSPSALSPGLERGLRALARADVELRPSDDHHHTYQTPGGVTVPLQTLQSLQRRRLARQVLQAPQPRFTLTEAGRRAALALQACGQA